MAISIVINRETNKNVIQFGRGKQQNTKDFVEFTNSATDGMYEHSVNFAWAIVQTILENNPNFTDGLAVLKSMFNIDEERDIDFNFVENVEIDGNTVGIDFNIVPLRFFAINVPLKKYVNEGLDSLPIEDLVKILAEYTKYMSTTEMLEIFTNLREMPQEEMIKQIIKFVEREYNESLNAFETMTVPTMVYINYIFFNGIQYSISPNWAYVFPETGTVEDWIRNAVKFAE